MAKKKRSPGNTATRRYARRMKKSNTKLAVGHLGGVALAVVQGQVQRRLAPKYKQAPRIIAVVSGLGGMAATMLGHEGVGAALMGPATGQAAIESSLVDIIPASEPAPPARQGK